MTMMMKMEMRVVFVMPMCDSLQTRNCADISRSECLALSLTPTQESPSPISESLAASSDMSTILRVIRTPPMSCVFWELSQLKKEMKDSHPFQTQDLASYNLTQSKRVLSEKLRFFGINKSKNLKNPYNYTKPPFFCYIMPKISVFLIKPFWIGWDPPPFGQKKSEYFLINIFGLAETLPPFWQKVKKKQFFMPPLINLVSFYLSIILFDLQFFSVSIWLLVKLGQKILLDWIEIWDWIAKISL